MGDGSTACLRPGDFSKRRRRSPDEVPLPCLRCSRRAAFTGTSRGRTRSEVLAAIVALLPLGPEVDRNFLLTVLDAREAMGSTGMGDGIAIPHVRNPILLHVDQPFVTLCLLRRPVEFGAIDGKPVHALFLVVSPTVPSHLRVLAQLAFVLRDPRLRQLLQERAPAEQILDHIRGLEHQTTGAFPVVPGVRHAMTLPILLGVGLGLILLGGTASLVLARVPRFADLVTGLLVVPGLLVCAGVGTAALLGGARIVGPRFRRPCPGDRGPSCSTPLPGGSCC